MLLLRERLAHAWRARSPQTFAASAADALGRAVVPQQWTALPDQLARLGPRVRLDGATFTLPPSDRGLHIAGLMRLGRYETHERYAVSRYLPRDLPVIEMGGGLGVVSCLINRLLASPSKHVCVEANPALLPILIENRDRNACRFTVRHAAVSYDAPTAAFAVDAHLARSQVKGVGSASETIEVATTTLSALVRETGFARCSWVADIEGAEAAVIERDREALAQHVQCAILEVHPKILGTARIEGMRRTWQELGFRFAWERSGVWVLER